MGGRGHRAQRRWVDLNRDLMIRVDVLDLSSDKAGHVLEVAVLFSVLFGDLSRRDPNPVAFLPFTHVYHFTFEGVLRLFQRGN